MSYNHIDYLKMMGLTEPLFIRVKKIQEFYKQLNFPENHILFISDYINDEGTREFESLWLIHKDYIAEAKNFVNEDDFDMVCHAIKVNYWQVKRQNYDIGKANEKSRLFIEFSIGHRTTATLKASKENCDHLFDIFTKFVHQNLK